MKGNFKVGMNKKIKVLSFILFMLLDMVECQSNTGSNDYMVLIVNVFHAVNFFEILLPYCFDSILTMVN